MQAIAISGFGGPEVFHAIEVPDPIVGDGQVIIDVRATSVNPIDQKIRSGFVPAITPAFPAVLHADVAGIVSAVGPGVTHLKEGDAVWGCAGGFKGLPSGALADRMLTDARLVGLKPASLNFQEAAALPLVGLTSWLSLVDRAQVQRGQRVLIHAGTGGVGHVGVQLAKALGAEVHTTVSSDHKASICRQLGADHTIFYTRENPEEYVHSATQGQGYDVVFDTVGGDNLDASFAAARVGGTVVNIAARSTHDLSPTKSTMMAPLSSNPSGIAQEPRVPIAVATAFGMACAQPIVLKTMETTTAHKGGLLSGFFQPSPPEPLMIAMPMLHSAIVTPTL